MFTTSDHVPIEETIALAATGRRVVHVQGDAWSRHVVEPRDLELFEALLTGLYRPPTD